MTFGVYPVAPALSWPVKSPDAFLDYSYDATNDLGIDTLASISVSIAPSGTGELTASSATFTAGLITVWLAGGVAGRRYIVKIIGTCPTTRLYEWAIGVLVDPALAQFPLAAPLSTGFGTPVTHP